MNQALAGTKIGLLFREGTRFNEPRRPMIEHLSALWKEMGADLVVIQGTAEFVSGVDLLIPHIDLTVTPENYQEYISRYSRVVNRELTDNSKTVISTNLLTRESSFDGPVIVKTDKNYGGFPEMKRGAGRALTSIRPGGLLRPWRRIRGMLPEHYHVVDQLRDVPEGVWENDRLVVEKFIPERDGEFFCHHISLVLGGAVMSRRLYSHKPIIKGNNIVRAEVVEAPADLPAVRKKFGMDYGKLDYVIRDGRIEVLDVNKTPGSPPMAGKNLDHLKPFAEGVLSLLG